MEAKDFELPIEGSLSKIALLHTQQQEEQAKTNSSERKPVKSLQKNKESFSKKRNKPFL